MRSSEIHKVNLRSIRFAGRNLSRPECVLCARSGDIFVSHRGSGILHINPGGEQRTIGNIAEMDGRPWIANGIAWLPDRSFLVANVGDGGGLWRLHANGRLEPFLLEIDGQSLGAANFVLADANGRIWITVTTRRRPLSAAFSSDVADGYVAVVDRAGARIVADRLAFTNELRLDAAGEYLYVVETFGRRIRRFRVGADAELSGSEVFTEFGYGTFPDGLAFDSEGCLWTASIVSNRVIRLGPDGRQVIVLEEADAVHIDRIEELLRAGMLDRSDILQTPAKVLKNISSIAFGGPDLRTVYLGSLNGDRLVTFRSPVAGLEPTHWSYRF